MGTQEKIELGDEVRCKVTGFQGICTSIAKCLTGCDRITIQPPIGKSKDGKYPESYWFDIAACELVKKQKFKPAQLREEGPEARPGGPPTKATR